MLLFPNSHTHTYTGVEVNRVIKVERFVCVNVSVFYAVLYLYVFYTPTASYLALVFSPTSEHQSNHFFSYYLLYNNNHYFISEV